MIAHVYSCCKVSKVCLQAKRPVRQVLGSGFRAWSDYEYFYSPLDGRVVHRRVIAGDSPVRVRYLPPKHNTMPPPPGQGLESRPLDPELSALTMRPPRHHVQPFYCLLNRLFSVAAVAVLVFLRLVFTSDGVVVGVMTRSVEWYDLGRKLSYDSSPITTPTSSLVKTSL